jgi:hypothetical protein
VIYRNSDLAHSIRWTPETHPEAAERATKFLAAERELLCLARTRSSAIVELNIFLETASDTGVEVHRGISGELLVTASDQALLLTGKTAAVLGSYIDDEPVTTSDRLDMTIRRRIG